MKKNILGRMFFFLCVSSTIYSCKNVSSDSRISYTESDLIPKIDYLVRNYYPHDTTSFTEGLFFKDGILFESTGSPESILSTRSIFGDVNRKTGRINQRVELDKTKYFGEGITYFDGKIYQLTYKNQTGFIYDCKNYVRIDTFRFPSSEGWGLTTFDSLLVMSDGSHKLYFLDPQKKMKIVRQIEVFENGESLNNLNELEVINGFIYANVFTTNYIVKIEPTEGKIVGKMDLSAIVEDVKNRYNGSLEMNGIAFDFLTNKVIVTGKMWPLMYEIEFNK